MGRHGHSLGGEADVGQGAGTAEVRVAVREGDREDDIRDHEESRQRSQERHDQPPQIAAATASASFARPPEDDRPAEEQGRSGSDREETGVVVSGHAVVEQVVDGGEAEGQAECPERHRDGRARSGAKSRIDDRDAEQDGDGNEAARQVVACGGARLRLEVVVVEDVQCHGDEADANDRRLEAHGSGEAEKLAATIGEPLRDCVPATHIGVPRARSASTLASQAGSLRAFRRGSRRRRRPRACPSALRTRSRTWRARVW